MTEDQMTEDQQRIWDERRLYVSDPMAKALNTWPRIVPARPIIPSDDVIDKRVEWNRGLSEMMVYGPPPTPRVLVCDKRGFVQREVSLEPERKTIGFKAFMETYADAK